MNRFMSTQKNTASTGRQDGGRTMTDFIIAKIHRNLINGNKTDALIYYLTTG